MSVEPIRYLVAFHAKPGKGRELRDVLEALLPELEMEDDCIEAALWQDNASPDRFLLVEHWMSAAGHDAFLQALDDVGAMDSLEQVLAEPPETHSYLRIT